MTRARMARAAASAVPFVVTVVGDPAPQGSKRHVGGGVLVESIKAVGPWRETVAAAVVSCMNRTRHDGYAVHEPVTVALVFYLRRPASLPKRVTRPATRPDIDKLVRAVLDACTTAGLLSDDAQVAALSAAKLYAAPGTPSRVVISAWPLT